MSLSNPLSSPDTADGPLITKAFLRAGEQLELSQKDMSGVLGISEAGVSRLVNKEKFLPARGKENEIALLFVRLFRSLGAILGSDRDNMRAWFSAFNKDLEGIPRELIKSLQGLIHVITYLDAMRGKI